MGEVKQPKKKSTKFPWVPHIHESILINALATQDNPGRFLLGREPIPWTAVVDTMRASHRDMTDVRENTIRNLKDRKFYKQDPNRWGLLLSHASIRAGLLTDTEAASIPALKYGMNTSFSCNGDIY